MRALNMKRNIAECISKIGCFPKHGIPTQTGNNQSKGPQPQAGLACTNAQRLTLKKEGKILTNRPPSNLLPLLHGHVQYSMQPAGAKDAAAAAESSPKPDTRVGLLWAGIWGWGLPIGGTRPKQKQQYCVICECHP